VSTHNILYELNKAGELASGKVLLVIGAGDSVPDGVAGYAKGCILIKPGTDAYVNGGDADSCEFKQISRAA
jgi:hypothetical protein